MKIIRIATRKSPLALWQAHHVGQLIKQLSPDLDYNLLPLQTSGDSFTIDKLQALGGKGLFVKELEQALYDNRADIAVHSMKDVPAELPQGLVIPIICQRDNPQDAFISPQYKTFQALPKGSVVGTSSLRRQAQLLALRPDLIIKPLRGNIHTRLAKLDAGDFDAIILATAGLERMGMQERIQSIIPIDELLPACAQGALGIECRAEDTALIDCLAALNHSPTAQGVRAERQVNYRLGGNCHIPFAVYGEETATGQFILRARVLSPDGQTIIHNTQQGTLAEAFDLANRCADDLLQQGAQSILNFKTF